MLEQATARRGQDKPPADPLKQGDAKLSLEFGHLPRQGRLRETDLARSRGQRPRVSGRAERSREVLINSAHA